MTNSFKQIIKDAEGSTGLTGISRQYDHLGDDIKAYMESIWPLISRTALMNYASGLMVDILCSSPIEVKLYFALIKRFRNELFEYPGSFQIMLNQKISSITGFLTRKNDLEEFDIPVDFIDYEIDILIYQDNRINKDVFGHNIRFPIYLGIECDGFPFHDRTKKQLQKDKKKDRNLKIYGLNIIRFTGSEITSTPDLCAEEVAKHLDSQRDRIQKLIISTRYKH